ncbi:MAG: ankyrin repeat domain-containing protein [Pseudomonadota bacterium]
MSPGWTVFGSNVAWAEIELLGNPALFKAILADDATQVKLLLADGESPEQRIPDGRTAFMYAMAESRLEMAEILLQSRIDINARDEQGNSALHIVVRNQDSVAVAFLLDLGIAIDAHNKEGATALMQAASLGHQGITRQLLQAGADTKLTDYTGRTARDWALRGRGRNLANLLR